MAIVLSGSLPVRAGPPFSTESPDIIGHGMTEAAAYIEGSRAEGYRSATLPDLQIDHGVLPSLQLRVTLPFSFAGATEQSGHYGIGDAQIGVKYRLLEEGDWWPRVSVFPIVLLPTGSITRGLGQGHPTLALPVWLGKNFGPWKVYGGGGYSFEGGPRSRNALFLGLAILRPVTERLSLGGDLFHKEPSRAGAPASTNVSIGGSYDFDGRYHLYFSVGRGIQNTGKTNESPHLG